MPEKDEDELLQLLKRSFIERSKANPGWIKYWPVIGVLLSMVWALIANHFRLAETEARLAAHIRLADVRYDAQNTRNAEAHKAFTEFDTTTKRKFDRLWHELKLPPFQP